MSRIAIALLSICAIFSSIVRPPRSLSQKADRTRLSSFSTQTDIERKWYTVTADIQAGDGSNSGLVVTFKTEEDGAVLNEGDVKEALLKFKVSGEFPPEMLKKAVEDFNSKKSAEIFLKSDVMQMVLHQKDDTMQKVMILSPSEISQGATQKIQMAMGNGRAVHIASSLATDQNTQKKVRQLDFQYVVNANADPLSTKITKKHVLLQVSVADPSFILPAGVAKKLARLINDNVSFTFTYAREEKSTVKTDVQVGEDEFDDSAMSITRVLANGMTLKFVLARVYADPKSGYGFDMVYQASGKRNGQKVTADDLLNLAKVFGDDITLEQKNVAGLLADLNDGKEEQYNGRFETRQSSPVRIGTTIKKALAKSVSQIIKSVNENANEAQVNQVEASFNLASPVTAAWKLSNDMDLEMLITPMPSQDGSTKSSKVNLQVSGTGKAGKVTAKELFGKIKDYTKDGISEEELGLLAESIQPGVEVTANFFIGEGNGVFYYPQIRQPKAGLVYFNGQWLSLQDIEILRQQNEKSFMSDGAGGYIYFKHIDGGQQVDIGTGERAKFDLRKLDINFEEFEEQKNAMLEAMQQQLNVQRNIQINGEESNMGQLGNFYAKLNHDGYTNLFNKGGQLSAEQLKLLNLAQQGGSGQQTEMNYRYRFENGKVYINDLAAMTEEEFALFLAKGLKEGKWTQAQTIFYQSIPIQGFESSKTYHIVNGKKMKEEEFLAWRNANPTTLLTEIDGNTGGKIYYYDKKVFDEFEFAKYAAANPTRFVMIGGNWATLTVTNVQQKQPRYYCKLGVRDGKVFVDDKPMDYAAYVKWYTQVCTEDKCPVEFLSRFQQITLETVRNSEWSVTIKGERYNREQFNAWLLNNPTELFVLRTNNIPTYYFGGKEYTEATWTEYANKHKDQWSFVDGQWRQKVVQEQRYQFGLNIINQEGQIKVVVPAKTQTTVKTITFRGKEYTEEQFKLIIEEYKRKGYSYTNGQFVFPTKVGFKVEEGVAFCNEKACSWEQYVQWRTDFYGELCDGANALDPACQMIQSMTKESFLKLSKIYAVGNQLLTKAEFEQWLLKHPKAKPRKSNGRYYIDLYILDDQEFTMEEGLAFAEANPWSGWFLNDLGTFQQRMSFNIVFSNGVVLLNGKQVTWEYFEKFRAYWLAHSKEASVVKLLNEHTKEALQASTRIYFIDNEYRDEAFYKAWLKTHQDWKSYEKDGKIHFRKPEPYCYFVSETEGKLEFKTKEDFDKFVTDKKIQVTNIGGNYFMEAPKITYHQIPVGVEINTFQIGGQQTGGQQIGGFAMGGQQMNAFAMGGQRMGGFEMGGFGMGGFGQFGANMQMQTFGTATVAESVPAASYAEGGAFGFANWASIKKPELRALLYSGALAYGTKLTDADVVSSTDFGMSNHKITVKIGGKDCTFKMFKSQSGLFDYTLESTEDACVKAIGQAIFDKNAINCGKENDSASIGQASVALLDRAKKLGVLSANFNPEAAKVRYCGLGISTISHKYPKMTLQYLIHYQVGNKLCQFKIYEKNNAFAYIENYAQLQPECKALLAGNRVLIR